MEHASKTSNVPVDSAADTLQIKKVQIADPSTGQLRSDAFLCGESENPLQVVLTHRRNRVSKIVSINRHDGSIVNDDPTFDDFFPDDPA